MIPRNADLDGAFEIVRLNAATDGLPPRLERAWFDAAFARCAQQVGLEIPARQYREEVVMRGDGTVQLAHTPTSPVQFYSGPALLATVPGGSRVIRLAVALCCYGCVTARYTYGVNVCDLDPLFLEAVARLFAYICENRGDTGADPNLIQQSGAAAFLQAGTTYVL